MNGGPHPLLGPPMGLVVRVIAQNSNLAIVVCVVNADKPYPDPDGLYAIAEGQAGYFVADQAATAGYSYQLLAHHTRAGRYRRLRRGLYRLVHYPVTEHEDYVALWLILERAAVFSHESALSLYGISDVMPRRTHVTLPSAWSARRLRLPADVVVHHDDLSALDYAEYGPIPVTTVTRTLVDLARSHFRPDLLRSAALESIERGLASRSNLSTVEEALAPYGGLEP